VLLSQHNRLLDCGTAGLCRARAKSQQAFSVKPIHEGRIQWKDLRGACLAQSDLSRVYRTRLF
jgi:hypothetical protein